MTALIITLFVIGYIFITLEHKFHIHKAITAAFLGTLLWIILAIRDGHKVEGATHELGGEVFSLVFFLLAAMTLVEILVHYRFFDFVRSKILKLGLTDFYQFWVIGGVSFVLSAMIDNLTATLVMLAIATRFFKGANVLIAAAGIVIAANAGGAWSPVGDVTTIMLWIAGKFSTMEIITWGILPSITIFLVAMFFLSRKIKKDTRDVVEEGIHIKQSEWFVIATALISFSFPLIAHSIGIQPYFGLLFGLGLTGVVVAITRNVYGKKLEGDGSLEDSKGMNLISGETPSTHLTLNIEKNLASADIAALFFFAGILLAVGALDYIGLLDQASTFLLGEDPSIWRLFGGIGALGVLSAIVDNIPLTAAAIEIITVTDPLIWVLLALAVGTGGSLLIIGSAAGVVAMGQVKGLKFFEYIKIATLPAFLGYVAGLGVWLLQYFIHTGF